ncbi:MULTISPECIES: hypothetical protein [Mycobacteroides]|uniref:hypothetical protein n=1 Tax=Mycobacteroides TaxID=670516 RepID=UPI00092B3331|nr:hypothetical protein [Mycobacteroides abscessus]SHT25398.1 Uncharacterised protein [Mycobacteroides abscessus subsp. abscessus]SHW69024.1 Uncharacterised protein [Mycobacteroides abscessus subsp. abscessus]SHY70903.1 Uncharacterised protein [Mycobacteroides abscessus subsp. abscessus]SHZ44209.1 Uncharacterised protein [Mycobacteroides abscessus subsp. abscessus]SKR90623.1 Uncharacterised protein [Mycobacteroides abscessus subsp. abscessus]
MSDATSPKYYQFGDVQLIAISGKLTGCGAQAVQYVARSTRMDGNNKGKTVAAQIEDLEKAKVFIGFEIDRLRSSLPKVVDTSINIRSIGGSVGTAQSFAYGGRV